MHNAGLDEAQAGIKIARRNINNLRCADDTTLMSESKEELKSLLMKVKEESEKVGLKLNIGNRLCINHLSCSIGNNLQSFMKCLFLAQCCMLAVTLLQAFNLGPRLEGRPCLNHTSLTDRNRGSKSFSQQQPGSLLLTEN